MSPCDVINVHLLNSGLRSLKRFQNRGQENHRKTELQSDINSASTWSIVNVTFVEAELVSLWNWKPSTVQACSTENKCIFTFLWSPCEGHILSVVSLLR